MSQPSQPSSASGGAPRPNRSSRAEPSLVVGVGTCADDPSALRTLLRGLPAETGIALVAVVHGLPERARRLADELRGSTTLELVPVRDTARLRADVLYLVPADRSPALSDGHLLAGRREEADLQQNATDALFRSLAGAGERAVAVVLSGPGTDGTLGAAAVRERGGLVLVQDPLEAGRNEMPASVVRRGHGDLVLPAAELGEALGRIAARVSAARPPLPEREGLAGPDEEAFRRVLAGLQARVGHDFSRYKPATLRRRIDRRLRVHQLDSIDAYADLLVRDPAEAVLLLEDLLIGVTQFFRDREVWAALESLVVPDLRGRARPDGELRVWVPACATGEEAYTIAMILLDRLGGEEAARRAHLQIFASDLDDAALAFARKGVYPEAISGDVPERYLARFFTRQGSHYRVKPEVRERVLFARHDLFRNPPFSNVHLVSCRNLLIYLQRELQEEALRVFHYALRPRGVLLLGHAESVDAVEDLFEPVAARHRIFRRMDRAQPPASPRAARLVEMPPRARPASDPIGAPELVLSPLQRHHRLLERLAPPSVLVDRAGSIVHLSESAGRFLRRPGGVPTKELVREVRAELRVELHAALKEAFERARPAGRGPVRVGFDSGDSWVHVVVQPGRWGGDPNEALVVFIEAGPPAETAPTNAPPADDPPAVRLQEELRGLRARLQTMVQEHEAYREAMRATNEELQSIGEEYKSAAEELETSKEELQSANEELEAVNRELTEKLAEISQANSDLQNLMAATEVGTLFLDRELRIHRYTPTVAELFHIRAGDQGRPLTDLARARDYPELLDDARHVLRKLSPTEREVRSPGERWLLARCRPYRTVEDAIGGVVLTFVDVTERKAAEEQLRALTEALEERVRERTVRLRRALDLFHELFHASPAPIAMTRPDGRLIDANQAYRDIFGWEETEDGEGGGAARRHWTRWMDDAQRAAFHRELVTEGRVRDFEVELRSREDELLTVLMFVERVDVAGGPYDLSVFVDITLRKRAEEQVRSLASKLTVAEQEERRRVAQVLHDDLQQRLYGVRYKLEAIRESARLNEAATEALRPLEVVERWLDDAIDEMRRLTVDLSPPVLEGEGLGEALQWLVRQMREMHDLDVTLLVDKTHLIQNPDQRIMTFRIVRELLFNVVKHAGVGRATIEITEVEGWWRIRVADEGRGFEPAVLERPGAGFGLPYLHERVGLFGGRLEIDSAPGRGARVTILLPVPEDAT